MALKEELTKLIRDRLGEIPKDLEQILLEDLMLAIDNRIEIFKKSMRRLGRLK